MNPEYVHERIATVHRGTTRHTVVDMRGRRVTAYVAAQAGLDGYADAVIRAALSTIRDRPALKP